MQNKTSGRIARMLVAAVAVPAMAITFQGGPAAGAAETVTAAPSAVAKTVAARRGPIRADKKDRAVYFIHGFQPNGKTDCKQQWSKTMSYLKDQKWTGKHIRWGYYAANKNCDYNYPGTVASTHKEISKSLAWHIFNNYTSKGKTVDVVTHSMGGVIIGNAIVHVNRGEKGFPKRLYVEDVVTLGMPKNNWLNKAGADLQANGGTDWTVVGSHADNVISVNAATSLTGAKHKIRYPKAEGLGHSDYYKKGTGQNWTFWRSSNYGKNYKEYVNVAPGPIKAVFHGIYFHSSR